MALKLEIIEVWVDNRDNSVEYISPDWIPMRVISLSKLSASMKTTEGLWQEERTCVICFHEGTGMTAEVPITEIYIKTLRDEQNKKSLDFDPPKTEKGEKGG